MKSKILNGLKSSIFFFFLILVSCGPAEIEQKKPKENKQREALVQMNRFIVKENVAKIKAFIERQKWNMTETKSGLWYEIYEKSNNMPCKKNDVVTIKYKVELLDGTFCYSSDSTGTKRFMAGIGKVEAGLEECVLMMKNGEKARLILPPHLAYGTQGDGNCIYPNAIVLYDIQLIDITNTKN